MPKQGAEYELFVKGVYECLNKADGLSDVQIQHDVSLKGAAGVEHQIDVFWTFKKGGVAYKVAIECKDYKSKVSKEKIATFHDILHDIGNVHGIFVSKMGYQSGAREYAEKYGIQLMEIRRPTDADWEGRMKDVHIQLHMRSIGAVKPHIFVNKAKMQEMGITEQMDDRVHASSDQVMVDFDEMLVDQKVIAEKETRTIYDLICMLPVGEAEKGKKHSFRFQNGMVHFEDRTLPVDAIQFTYDIYESTDHIDIYGDDVIKAIVKNITESTETHIDKYGSVSPWRTRD